VDAPDGLRPRADRAYLVARQPFVPTADLEGVARRVRGVYACRVLRGGDEALPERVRLVAQASRRLAVARDVQSAWFAAFGLYVPRERFAVTAVRSRLDLLPERRRLQLCRLELVEEDGVPRVAVALYWQGRVFHGECRGVDDRARAAALATSYAVRAALPPGAELELLEVRSLVLGGQPAVACAVAAGPRVLFGLAADAGAVHEAAARAVLDATNRLLALGEEAAGRFAR
jgi:hypothetical protein